MTDIFINNQKGKHNLINDFDALKNKKNVLRIQL